MIPVTFTIAGSNSSSGTAYFELKPSWSEQAAERYALASGGTAR
jgi:hypothetical protein